MELSMFQTDTCKPVWSLWDTLMACGDHACLVMGETTGYSHHCLQEAAHPQLAYVHKMGAVAPHIAGAAQVLGDWENLLLTECYVLSEPLGVVSCSPAYMPLMIGSSLSADP